MLVTARILSFHLECYQKLHLNFPKELPSHATIIGLKCLRPLIPRRSRRRRTIPTLPRRARRRPVIPTGRTLTVLAGRRRTVLTRRGTTVLARRRTAVLAGRRTTILTWWRTRGRSAVLAWRRAAVAAVLRRRHAGAQRHVGLLVFGVVARVDGAEDELDHPEIRGEIDRWLGAGHLCGFVLVV